MTLVRWTDQAADDLKAIREFIERDSPRYGRLVAERLFDATQRLEVFPLSGRVVPELGRDDVREIILGEYRIVRRVESETVLLVPVFAALPDCAFGPLILRRALTRNCCCRGRALRPLSRRRGTTPSRCG